MDIPHKLLDTEFWIFDLDNTLYSAECRLFLQIQKNMTKFIMNFLDIDHDEAFAVQKTYFRDHGTTMKGLMVHHGIDPYDYLQYVHQIDLSNVPENPKLDTILSQLPGKKMIFTNGSTGHAKNIIGHLGIARHFEKIYDIVDSNFIPKPAISVYQDMIAKFNINPEKSVMVEDMAKNLRPAADLGMTTVWVRTSSPWAIEDYSDSFIHHVAEDLTSWLDGIVNPVTNGT